MISREVRAKLDREHRRVLAILHALDTAVRAGDSDRTASHLARLTEAVSGHLSLVKYVMDSLEEDQAPSSCQDTPGVGIDWPLPRSRDLD